jgi:hypothetical protein
MTCPRITRAIKASTLAAPLKHTLRVLTDHINSWKDPTTGQVDHTRPATLEVYEPVVSLAAETGYSKPTVMAHLLKLRGFTPVPGAPQARWPQDEQRAVLELIAKSRQHTAARYRLNLERLEALQRSRNLTAEPAEVLPADESQRLKNFTSEENPAVKFSGSSGKISLPESFPALPQDKKNFLAHAPETKRTRRPDFTPAPAHLTLPEDFMAWFNAEVPELDLGKEREAFLGHCRRRQILNQYWDAAFKDWLLKAYARWQRGEPCASSPHPGRQTPAAATPVATVTRTSCSWAGCDESACGHGPQSCRGHGWGSCPDCLAEAAGRPRERLMAAAEESPAATDAVTVGVAAPEALAEAEETWPPEPREEPDDATPAPLVAVGALLQDVLAGHAMPSAMPPPRPLGSAPPARAASIAWLRKSWEEEDQPLYHRLIAQRRAREAQPAALAAEGGDSPHG